MRGWLAWPFAIAAGIPLVLVLPPSSGPRRQRRDGARGPVGAEHLRHGRRLAGRHGGDRRRDTSGAGPTGTGLAEPQSQTPQGSPQRLRPRRAGGQPFEATEVDGQRRSTTPASPTPTTGAAAATQAVELGATSRGRPREGAGLARARRTPSRSRSSATRRRPAVRSRSRAREWLETMTTSRSDPELAAALTASSTCQQLQEDTGR